MSSRLRCVAEIRMIKHGCELHRPACQLLQRRQPVSHQSNLLTTICFCDCLRLGLVPTAFSPTLLHLGEKGPWWNERGSFDGSQSNAYACRSVCRLFCGRGRETSAPRGEARAQALLGAGGALAAEGGGRTKKQAAGDGHGRRRDLFRSAPGCVDHGRRCNEMGHMHL